VYVRGDIYAPAALASADIVPGTHVALSTDMNLAEKTKKLATELNPSFPDCKSKFYKVIPDSNNV
jgi:hypothetical protein